MDNLSVYVMGIVSLAVVLVIKVPKKLMQPGLKWYRKGIIVTGIIAIISGVSMLVISIFTERGDTAIIQSVFIILFGTAALLKLYFNRPQKEAIE